LLTVEILTDESNLSQRNDKANSGTGIPSRAFQKILPIRNALLTEKRPRASQTLAGRAVRQDRSREPTSH